MKNYEELKNLIDLQRQLKQQSKLIDTAKFAGFQGRYQKVKLKNDESFLKISELLGEEVLDNALNHFVNYLKIEINKNIEKTELELSKYEITLNKD